MYDVNKIYEANTIKEAVELRTLHPDAIIIGGGSDVLIKIREGKLSGCDLISIYMIDELRGVDLLPDKTLKIGSLTSFSHITENELVKDFCPTIGEAVATAGGPQLRNIATIGGNISNGVPSADSATTLLAYDAIVELVGKDGTREVPITQYYIKTGVVDIRETEIVTAIKIKKESYEGYVGHYFKYAMRDAMDIATSSCSINVKFKDGNIVEDVRASFGVAGPVPLRTYEAEKFLKGKPLTKENIDEFAKEALKELKPRDSWRASKELREHILKEIAKRCLYECLKKYEGGKNA